MNSRNMSDIENFNQILRSILNLYHLNIKVILTISSKPLISSKEFIFIEAPTIKEGPNDFEFKLSQSSIFNCLASGDPKPKIIWYKNQEKVDLSNGKYTILANNSLMIENSNQEDEGYYSCSAENILGQIISRPARMVFRQTTSEQFGKVVGKVDTDV